jgi:hypothetical protein
VFEVQDLENTEGNSKVGKFLINEFCGTSVTSEVNRHVSFHIYIFLLDHFYRQDEKNTFAMVECSLCYTTNWSSS